MRVGCGAGFSGDRIDPAVELATHGALNYLVFECLAERTIALAQLAKMRDPHAGYDPLLVRRMEAVLPACVANSVKIITNMGAANPAAAAAMVRSIAARLGLPDMSVATIGGDDVLEIVREGTFTIAETNEPVRSLGDRLVSANAYIGAQPIVEALARGADVVMAGRVADPALFVGPLAHEFGWSFDDWQALGRGTLVGHLLECAGQVTGGYFADPGPKDVGDLDRLGFPIAEVPESGPVVITKVEGSGGRVTTATCKEQLLYEIHDPTAYITPDAIADFSRVRVIDAGHDRVAVEGASGVPRPDRLKVSLGYRDGFIGEGQISYGGVGAVARGRLAADIVVARLRRMGIAAGDIRADLIGVDALHGGRSQVTADEPYEVRVRIAARRASRDEARHIGHEIESLYTNGPAGGGGAVTSVREVLSVASTFIPRELVHYSVTIGVPS
jgi:hypothetical protein